MPRLKLNHLFILVFLSLFTTGIGLFAYTGPGNRSSVSSNVVKVLVCDSTQYTGGPVVWRYRDWLGLSAPEGSANALSWMAQYPNVDDPSTPICHSGRQGEYVWQLVAGVPVSYAAATVADTYTCSLAGTNGWCKNASIKFTAQEPIPGEKITIVESGVFGTLCTINAASGSCTWSPDEGDNSMNFWAVSTFGDTSLKQNTTWMLDKTVPALAIVVPAVNGSNGWFVSAPTLSLSASDTVSGIASAIFSGGGATKVVSADGSSSVSATATDAAGNITTKSVTIKKDSGLPTVSVPLAPNGTNGWYSTRPTLAASASDAVSGVASAFISLNGGSWLASVSPADGTASVAGRATDNAGNVATSSAQTVLVDTVAPSVALARAGTLTNGWYTTDVSITASASDATSGLSTTEYRVNGGAWTAGSAVTLNTDGTHVVDFRATDKAGLVTSSSQTVKIDKTNPALGFSPSGTLGSNGWYKTTVALTMSASDPASGVASFEYRLDGGVWTTGSAITLTDGTHTVDTRATDIAGNASTSSFSAKVDTGLPALSNVAVGTSGSNGWYVSNVTFTATSSDSMSGLALTEYSVDGGTWKSGSVVTVIADGSHVIDFRATDNAGNRSTNTRSIKVDQTDPAVSFAVPVGTAGANGWFTSPVGLGINRSDATSGIAADEYRLNNGAWTPITVDLNLVEGVNTVEARVTDKAGNQTLITKTVNVDLTPPQLNITIQEVSGATGWYNTPVTLTGLSSDDGSGVAEVAYSLDQGMWQAGKTALIPDDGPHRVDFVVKDRAGLQVQASQVLKIDQTPPKSAFSSPPEGSLDTPISKTFTFSGSSADNLAGLARADYSLNNGLDWHSLSFKDGQWSFDWDTTTARDGNYTILVRADDIAGNRENTARVSVQVSNKKPIVDVQETWNLGQAGTIMALAGSVPLKAGSLLLSCPLHQDLRLSFPADLIPSVFEWDRRCGDGAFAAESGDYQVTVEVCDVFDRCTKDSGLIHVPEFATPTPTMTAAVQPTRTSVPTSTRQPTITPTQIIPVATLPALQPEPEPELPKPVFPWSGLSLGLLLACLLAFSFAAVIDPRPRALARLRKALIRISGIDHHLF
jgi:hypothetical protein